MAYETVPLQQLLREIAGRTASELDADVIRLAADTLDESVVPGEIVDMEYASSIGDYFGSFRCPECEAEVQVRLREKRRRCACGIVWDFDVSATAIRENW